MKAERCMILTKHAQMIATLARGLIMLVGMTLGHKLLTFMDAFSGYNQICMAPKDHKHTASIMDRGVYYHKVMPSGLKNVGATYQRMIN